MAAPAKVRWIAALSAADDGRRGAIASRGKRVLVNIAGEAEAQGESAIAARLGRLLAEIDNVIGSASADLARLYNGAWRGKDGSTASAASIEKKVRLTTVNLDAAGWTLYFADGKIFGGHTIEVWRGKRGVETNLVG